MKKLILLISLMLALPFLSVLTSCYHKTSAWSTMDKAESLMNSRPDSALMLLESLSYSDLIRQEDIALYALLYTQALDKNHLIPTNDSLISISTHFYNSQNNPLRQVLSNYYQGRVRYNANNNQSAIVSFFKAKEIAETNGYDFWAGMCSRGISDIYNGTYNAAEELHYAKEEYNYIKKSHKQPYLNYAIYDLGRALRNNGHFDESLTLAGQLQDSAITYQDSYLYYIASQLKAFDLSDIGEFSESYQLLSEICATDYAETHDTLYLCHNLFEMGRIDEAENILRITSNYNLPFKSQIRYRIAKTFLNYPEALKEAEFIDSLANADFKSSISHNLTTSISEYYNLQKKLDEAEIKSSRIMICAIIITSLSVISILILIGWQIYTRQNRKISDKVLLANQLQDDLSKSRKDNTKSASIIKSLMATKYELLEELCSIVLRNSDTKVAKRKIADTVTKIIDDFSLRSDKIVDLEQNIDKLHNNLMTDFKSDLPNLKEMDYRLFLFSVLGLSNATISLFLKEEKIDAVYNRKRRIKDKLKLLEGAKSERYLAYF